MARAVRRVVLSEGDGGAVVRHDDASPHVVEVPGMAGLALTDLWYTDDAPASLSGAADAADRELSVAPPPRGTLFRVVEFPPDAALAAAQSSGAAGAAALGVAGPTGSGPADDDDDGLIWHQTDTVDFNVVLEGALALHHAGGRVELGPGDTVVVRGIRHAWSNPGDVLARLAAVAVGAAR